MILFPVSIRLIPSTHQAVMPSARSENRLSLLHETSSGVGDSERRRGEDTVVEAELPKGYRRLAMSQKTQKFQTISIQIVGVKLAIILPMVTGDLMRDTLTSERHHHITEKAALDGPVTSLVAVRIKLLHHAGLVKAPYRVLLGVTSLNDSLAARWASTVRALVTMISGWRAEEQADAQQMWSRRRGYWGYGEGEEIDVNVTTEREAVVCEKEKAVRKVDESSTPPVNVAQKTMQNKVKELTRANDNLTNGNAAFEGRIKVVRLDGQRGRHKSTTLLKAKTDLRDNVRMLEEEEKFAIQLAAQSAQLQLGCKGFPDCDDILSPYAQQHTRAAC
ncbi:hypothetical protein V8D89_009467 [Ganoderma adspersum]